MHAIFCFLITDECGGESLGPVEDYLNYKTDENNWYQGCLKVQQDGTIFSLCENGDWRGRDGWYEDYAKVPQKKRWAKVIKLAEGCVRSEVESAIHCVTGDYKYELPKIPLRELPKEMGRVLAETAAKDNSQNSLYWYGVENLGNVMGQFEYLAEDLPFTSDDEDPYHSIRAIDMREYVGGEYSTKRSQENMAIVLVDIHT